MSVAALTGVLASVLASPEGGHGGGAGSLAMDLMAILGVAAVVATIFARLRLESIPGFLLAGVLIGPHVLGVVRDTGRIAQISDLAIILLMFGIGLHLDLGTIRRGMVHILAIGVVSTLGVIGVCWGVLSACGVSAPIALLIALALSMSSTAVFVRVVAARREVRTAHGRVGLGISIVQDLLAVVALALVPALARWAGLEPKDVATEAGWYAALPRWLEYFARAGVSIGGVVIMIMVGKVVLPRVLREVAKTGSGELVLVLSGAIAFGAALLTRMLGFSPEMGAFLAGFQLAATPFRYQLSGHLAPIRDLLMAVFFTSVGLKVDPAVLASSWWIVGLGVLGVMVVKMGALGMASWLLGMTAPASLLTAVYLGNAGEFTLVVLGSGVEQGMISEHQQAMTVGVVILSLVITPLLVAPAHRMMEWAAKLPLASARRGQAVRDEKQRAADASKDARLVIIAGFGPVGRALADRFEVQGVPFAVIELNPKTVERQSALGRTIVYGDVTNPDVLESAGLRHADAVLITIPDDETMLRACQVIRGLAPHVFIGARANFLSGRFAAHSLGADLVTVEEVATAQSMEREVLRALEKRHEQEAMARNAPGRDRRNGDEVASAGADSAAITPPSGAR